MRLDVLKFSTVDVDNQNKLTFSFKKQHYVQKT